MTNIVIYKRVNQLRDFLENTEFNEYTRKELEAVNKLISDIFTVLDRRSR